MKKPCNSSATLCYVSVTSDEGAILSTLLYWVVAVCCVARWWTGCVVGSPGLVPGTLRSLPGHPRGGSVQPRSFPPACLQEMQDKGGLRQEARRWRQGRTDLMKGGEGGHDGGLEVPRLSLDLKDEVWSSQECIAGFLLLLFMKASCFMPKSCSLSCWGINQLQTKTNRGYNSLHICH